MKDQANQPDDIVRALCTAYCDAIHFSKPDVFQDLCHDNFVMFEMANGAVANTWDKAAYLARVAGRDAFPGTPSYKVLSVDMTSAEMARAHLWVDVPPKRYEDHLGFVFADGSWKLLTKVFRTMEG